MVINVGETTTVSIAATKSASLRTTIPMSVVKQFNLESGDKLDWIFDVKDGNMVIILRPIKARK